MSLYKPKLQKQFRLHFLLSKIKLLAYIVLPLILLVYFLARQDFSISKINFENNYDLKYQDFAKQKLLGKNFFVFLFYGKNKFLENFSGQFPEIDNAHFKLLILKPKNILISLSFLLREPVGLVCNHNADFQTFGCYFYDKNGFIFGTANELMSERFPILIFDNLTNFKPKQTISSIAIKDIEKIRTLFGNFNLTIDEIISTKAEDYKITFKNFGFYVLVNQKRIDDNILNLKVFLSKKFNNDPKYSTKILYLDARYKDKIFEEPKTKIP